MFPMDYPIMPLNHDINFDIDVDLSSKLIYIPSFWMASTKLKKLYEQLKDLLSKEFVIPSVHPWDASILFVKKKDSFMHM